MQDSIFRLYLVGLYLHAYRLGPYFIYWGRASLCYKTTGFFTIYCFVFPGLRYGRSGSQLYRRNMDINRIFKNRGKLNYHLSMLGQHQALKPRGRVFGFLFRDCAWFAPGNAAWSLFIRGTISHQNFDVPLWNFPGIGACAGINDGVPFSRTSRQAYL